jgi:hypothetical protein
MIPGQGFYDLLWTHDPPHQTHYSYPYLYWVNSAPQDILIYLLVYINSLYVVALELDIYTVGESNTIY